MEEELELSKSLNKKETDLSKGLMEKMQLTKNFEEGIEVSQNLFNIIVSLQKFCTTTKVKTFNKEIFSIKFKILYIIYKFNKVSPSVLVGQTKIAKSNIALFCKQLLLEGFIQSSVDTFDKRILYYSLTKKGLEVLQNNFRILSEHIKSKFVESKYQDLNKSIKRWQELFG